MAENKRGKISQLPYLENIEGGESLLGAADGKGYQVTIDTLKRYVGGSGGGGSVDLTNIQSHVLPSFDDYYSLGSAQRKWKSLHTNALHLGTSSLMIGTSSVTLGTDVEQEVFDVVGMMKAQNKEGKSSLVMTEADMGEYAKRSDLPNDYVTDGKLTQAIANVNNNISKKQDKFTPTAPLQLGHGSLSLRLGTYVDTLNLGTHIAQGATLGLEIDTDGGLRVKLGEGLGYGDNGEIINTREAGKDVDLSGYYTKSETDSKVDAVNTKATNAASTADTAKSDASKAQSTADSALSKAKANEGSIGALGVNNTTLSNKINEVDGVVKQNKTDIATLNNTTKSLQGSINDLNVFKSSALSDLETLMTFYKGTDTDTTIDKWQELETVLKGLTETDNLAEMLSGKADKSTVYTKTDVDTMLGSYATASSVTELTAGVQMVQQDLLLKIGGKADKNYVDSNFVSNDRASSFAEYGLFLNIGDDKQTITINGVSVKPLYSHQTLYSLTLKDSAGNQIFAYDPKTELSGVGYVYQLTKSNVGLSNVENKSSATIRGEITSSNVTNALGYIPTSLTENDLINKGFVLSSALSGYLPLNGGGVVDGSITIRAAHEKDDSWLYFTDKKTANSYAIGFRRPSDLYGLTYRENNNHYKIYHEGNLNPTNYLSKNGGTFSGSDSISFDSNGNIKLNTKSHTYWHVDTPDGNAVFVCHNNGTVGIKTTNPSASLDVSGDASISKDLGGKLADWILYQHGGPFEAGRASNAMKVAIGVTDDDYGYIQVKGYNITSIGKLVLQPADGAEHGDGGLFYSNKLYAILHTGNLQSYIGTALNNALADYGFATVAKTGSYNDLSNKPTILSETDLVNKGFVLSTALANYLPLSGGKMTGPIEYDDYTSLGVHSNGNFYLGNPARPLVIRSNGTHTINGNTLIHSGNIGSQSVANATNFSNHSINEFAQYLPGNGYIQFNLLDSDMHPLGKGDGLIEYYDNGGWYNSMWGKVFAVDGFVGNLSGTATAANKLSTARTIWGKSFDGSGDVLGKLWLYGNNNYYTYLEGDASGMVISSWQEGVGYLPIKLNPFGGNVGISTTDPKAKLHVVGSEQLDGNLYIGSNGYINIGDINDNVWSPINFYRNGYQGFIGMSDAAIAVGVSNYYLLIANRGLEYYINGKIENVIHTGNLSNYITFGDGLTASTALNVSIDTGWLNDLYLSKSGGAFSGDNSITFDSNGNIKLNSKNGTYWHVDRSTGVAALTINSAGHVEISEQLWVGKFINVNRNGSTGAIIDKSRCGVEIEPYASHFAIKGYANTGGHMFTINVNSKGVGIGTNAPQKELHVVGKHLIQKDLGANLSDWINYQHEGPFEVGRSSNEMRVAIGVTDDNYGYIQVKGYGITSVGSLVLQPGITGTAFSKLYYSGNLWEVIHEGNIGDYAVAKKADGSIDVKNAIYFTDATGEYHGNMVMSSSLISVNVGFFAQTISATTFKEGSYSLSEKYQAKGNYLSSDALNAGLDSFKLNRIICKNNTNYSIGFGSLTISSNLTDISLYPYAGYYIHLGGENNPWYGVYANSFNNTSDATKKNILGDVNLSVNSLANAPAKVFTWKDGLDNRRHVGTIAQYWRDVLPEVVSGKEGSMSMNYAELAVVSSIILARNVETHEQRIQRLEQEITNLQNELDELRKNSE